MGPYQCPSCGVRLRKMYLVATDAKRDAFRTVIAEMALQLIATGALEADEIKHVARGALDVIKGSVEDFNHVLDKIKVMKSLQKGEG